MDTLSNKLIQGTDRPVKVLQFGEGNFLRAFVDYMIDVVNEAGLFNGNIALVKPISFGNLDVFHKQDCKYTVSLRGKENGEIKQINRVVTSVSDAVAAIEEYDKYAAYAKSPDLRFVVSNTTEAGIVFEENDDFNANPPKTFPGKLTKFLFERFNHFNGDKEKGLVMIPCELIENNGGSLKNCVNQYAKLWKLGADFESWIEDACIFCSTLVDRIVTGYPKDEAETIFKELGYEDALLVTGEIFGLWVIESDKDISGELPLDKAGLPVIFTDNQKPYRERKVRILNGAHTSFVLASYLAGNDYVLESMQDKTVNDFMTKTIYDEIIPTLTLPKEELTAFADSVIERFENPYIKHALLSISLNSVSKWKSRCLPSFTGYIDKFGKLPVHLSFSLAALISFYRSNVMEEGVLIGQRGEDTYKIMDDQHVLEFFKENSKLAAGELVAKVLSNKAFFGTDLTVYQGLTELLTGYVEAVEKSGMRTVMENLSE
ncbi:altronate oxidoreductase [Anaerocolumna cellulosilytica]|uniref:Altronate oxidoreductase n=1 Tax=Anaerocolumna cellulosilytica TaxID=433286 RepID=A0A6S6QV59_9FIRM|nr:tagaturonate reductase [Anaerocolumna cellulosilytica]MBB5197608.1 tagaturonate reductase [Anaerocolumna cellulosilytica]BCJ95133.1 altronate oxidoreductase [Anaerocolumna cellulosilytica]